jgi:hypothetical protein
MGGRGVYPKGLVTEWLLAAHAHSIVVNSCSTTPVMG